MPLSIDMSSIAGYAKALREAPNTLRQELAFALNKIGREDIAAFRSKVPSQLQPHGSKKVANTFKFAASNPVSVHSFRQLFLSEYTRWPAAKIFQQGGGIRPVSAQALMLRFADQNGNRLTVEKIKALARSGKIKFIKTPGKGVLIVERPTGGWGKKVGGVAQQGKIIGMLRRGVTEPKRLEFFENFEDRSPTHEAAFNEAVANTLEKINNGTAR